MKGFDRVLFIILVVILIGVAGDVYSYLFNATREEGVLYTLVGVVAGTLARGIFSDDE